MVDRYTKTALTVIALALCVLALQRIISPAAAVGVGCGDDRYNPCYVRVVG